MRRLVLTLLTAALVLLGGSTAAHAEGGSTHQITRYEVSARAAQDGAIAVTVDFDFDFADEPAHGPYMVIPERQRIPDDPRHWRTYTIDQVSASSPSGAPDRTVVESDNGVLAIRIGDESQTISGQQSYQVSYTITGVVNPVVANSDLQEINWSIIGQQWEVPIRNATVRLEGPGAVQQSGCFTGPGFNQPCQASTSGSAATFTDDSIPVGDGMQIVASYPPGTFVGAEPQLIPRVALDTMFVPSGAALAGGGVVAALGAALAAVVLRRRRDQAYVGVAHGHLPDNPSTAATTVADRRAPVTVQFHPPRGLRPGQLGTLTDEKADPQDVTATIVDLAVRGHLRIEPSDAQSSDWRLVRLSTTPQDLRPYEQQLFAGIFAVSPTPVLSGLRRAGFPSTVQQTQQALYTEVTDLGWYTHSPQATRARWFGMGTLIVLAGVAVAVLLGGSLGLGLIGIGLALVGVLVAVLGFWAPSRTALGTAALQQALGFREYIRTAEADQIRFEEGIDVFSRYLPYAIAWGLTDRWARVFAELAETRGYQPDLTWYGGVGYGYGMAALASGPHSLASSLGAFSGATATAMTSATSGSGGMSGFSGGGGVGGGGGGSW